MAETTNIQWCDATLNLWWGCTKVSDGCKHCYAETLSDQRYKRGAWGPTGTRVEVKSWRSTLNKIAKRAKAENRRLKVFCQSMSDTFEGPETCGGIDSNNWRLMDRLREELWQAVEAHQELDFLILTKRPENIIPFWLTPDCGDSPEERAYCGAIKLPPNLWIGTSVEDQKTADERIPHLLSVPAAVRFLSCEPLLGPVDLDEWLDHDRDNPCRCGDGECSACWQSLSAATPNWVICGGESGPNARPMHPDWARSLHDQCVAANVPFFFKQWGEWGVDWSDSHTRIPIKGHDFAPDWNGASEFMFRIGKHSAGRLLDGREWNEFPEEAS
jgi:protein gp37